MKAVGGSMPAASRMSSTRTPSQLVSNLRPLGDAVDVAVELGLRQRVELVPGPALQRARAVLQGETPGIGLDDAASDRRRGPGSPFSRYWPGGSRLASSSERRRPKNPRVMPPCQLPSSKRCAMAATVVEGIGGNPAADQESVSDEPERRGIDMRTACHQQLVEFRVDLLVFARRRLDGELAVDLEPGAAFATI